MTLKEIQRRIDRLRANEKTRGIALVLQARLEAKMGELHSIGEVREKDEVYNDTNEIDLMAA